MKNARRKTNEVADGTSMRHQRMYVKIKKGMKNIPWKYTQPDTK